MSPVESAFITQNHISFHDLNKKKSILNDVILGKKDSSLIKLRNIFLKWHLLGNFQQI